MAHKDLMVCCESCKHVKEQRIYYTPDEELAVKARENDGRYYTRIWSGVFVFGITVLLFIWALVLMLKTFEMKKLEKVLSDPNVHYEDVWYNTESDNPAFKTDAKKVLKNSKEEQAKLEILQAQLDLVKQNASNDREVYRKDFDNLMKVMEALRTKLLKQEQGKPQ